MKTQDLSGIGMILAAIVAASLLTTSANAELLVYEPFDYPDAALNGQGGALGTTGTWTTADTGFPAGMWCHPEGELTGQFDDRGGGPNMFDGTVDNLPTSGGFVGSAGPVEQGFASGTRRPTGNMDANIGLDPSVTATFQSGTTTWFSYVGAHADNRNAGSPTFMLCTDPTNNGTRGLTMQNSGNGIGGVGGPTRFNLHDVYPHYFSDGVHHQSPGGYLSGAFGGHNGIVAAFCSTGTCDGVLDESGLPRTQTMAWQISDDNGFGAPNIVVGKIEWDADSGGEDIVSVVRFLETEELSEAAFDALVAALPPLSSKNWASNKPDLDQGQFDVINISSLKFYVDELRIATTFGEATGGNASAKPQLEIAQVGDDLVISWASQGGMLYNLRSETDPSNREPKNWPIHDGNMDIAATPDINTLTIALPAEASRFFVIEEFPLPPVTVFSENFDGADPGWATGFDASDTAMNTIWQLGAPSGGPLTGPPAAKSGLNCYGTNLAANYGLSSNIWLRTPPGMIDLTTATGATLLFQQWVEIDEFDDLDRGTVRVLDASVLPGVVTELDVVQANINGLAPAPGSWVQFSAELPAAALGQSIVLEFGFVSDGDDIFDSSGWYLDDVIIITPAP
jgi:hypothetical protein